MYEAMMRLAEWDVFRRAWDYTNDCVKACEVNTLIDDPEKPVKCSGPDYRTLMHGYNEMICAELVDAATGEVVVPRELKGGGPLGYCYCFSPIQRSIREREHHSHEVPLVIIPGKYEMDVRVGDDILEEHFKVYEREWWSGVADITAMRANRDWWWNQCISFGVPMRIIGEGNIRVKYFPDHKESLIYLGLSDYFQRMPGLVWAYQDLLRSCPGVKPWYLFQVAHMLPWACNTYGGRPKMRDDLKGKVAQYFGLFCHGQDYQCGVSRGTWTIKPSLESCVESTKERGGINAGFFPRPDTDRVPRWDWTIEQFAEFARFHIAECVASEQCVEADAVCS